MKPPLRETIRHSRRLQVFFTVSLVTIFLAASSIGAAYPEPRGAVNDFAGVIPRHDQTAMEDLSREVWEKTGTAIVVAAFASIGGNDAAVYANELYTAWGIGKKGEDKGVLILLAVKERKVRIETGYGVEGILPDGLAGEVLDRYALPHFRAGDFSKGLRDTVIAVADIVARDAGVTLTGAPVRTHQQPPRETHPGGIIPVILLFLAAAVLLGTKQGRAALPYILVIMMSSSGRRGGGFGGFGGGFGGFGGGMSGGGGAGRGF